MNMNDNRGFLNSAFQYLTLVFVAGVVAILFQQTPSNLNRFLYVVLFGFLYILWGYWHHGNYDRVDRLVIVEYSLVSLIMILLSALGLGVIRFF